MFLGNGVVCAQFLGFRNFIHDCIVVLQVVVKYIAFLRSKGVDLNALFDRIIVNK